jgi:hypothetical protein
MILSAMLQPSMRISNAGLGPLGIRGPLGFHRYARLNQSPQRAQVRRTESGWPFFAQVPPLAEMGQ